MSASAGPSVGSHHPTGLKFQRANYYLWEEPERGVRIYLSLAIVDRLQLEVLRGIDGFPSDQAEVGGILIGRTESDGERTITLIEDFAPVPCGYRAGPFYRLTEKDAVKFEGVLARCSSDPRGLSVVGYYRSHNRDDLCLSPDDLNLIHRYFSEPDKVFLLVKTLPSKACTAGFFFWEDGHIQSEFTYLEVPFGPVKSYSITEPGRLATVWAKDRLTPVAKDLGKDLTAQSRGLSESARKSRRVWVVRGLAVIAAAVVVTLAGFNYLRSKQSPPHEPPSASLRLHVVRQAGSLALTWNPASQDLIGAEKAILYINEGSNQKAVHLDPIELRRGEVSFAPSGDDVELRFEIDRDGRPSAAERIHLLLPNIAVGDTVREKVVNSTNSQGAPDLKTRTIESRANSSRRELPPATSAKKEQGAQMARLNSSVSSPQPFRFVAPARAFKTSNNALATSDIQIEQPPSIPIETQISELIVSAPIVRPEAPPPSNNPTQSAIERRPLAQSETSLASVTPPVTGKAGPSQPPPVTTFVGPHVIRQVNPSIPVDLRYKITPDIEIEVAVTIDEYGKVTDAKLASTKGVGARFFSAEVLRAARLFLFRPAQDNNRSVRSSMLLTFRFSGGPPK